MELLTKCDVFHSKTISFIMFLNYQINGKNPSTEEFIQHFCCYWPYFRSYWPRFVFVIIKVYILMSNQEYVIIYIYTVIHSCHVDDGEVLLLWKLLLSKGVHWSEFDWSAQTQANVNMTNQNKRRILSEWHLVKHSMSIYGATVTH